MSVEQESACADEEVNRIINKQKYFLSNKILLHLVNFIMNYTLVYRD